jgi:hypothetical protein
MEHIDVHDLPQPVVRAIASMVDEIRRELGRGTAQREAKELPLWDGQIIGSLSRDEIYDDNG